MKHTLTVLCLLALTAGSAGAGNTILGSKHDLSAVGPGPIRADTEREVCIFCHTPHRSLDLMPLWNHAVMEASYTPYSSSTMGTVVGQPTGSSKLCLSCHDGTVAIGMVNSRSDPIVMRDGVERLPLARSNLRTDLSDDHPVSFSYENAMEGGGLKPRATLTERVRLDHRGEVQCTSCHDPHRDEYGKFLVMPNKRSALCVACHSVNLWEGSSHQSSSKPWNGSGLNPWPNTGETTVEENACGNCHTPHAAQVGARLLTYAGEELACYVCHNGNVAAKNIESVFSKAHVHPVALTSGVHDPAEDTINPPRHAECADCHNPHASKEGGGAGGATGALAGVRGVNAAGAVVQAVSWEYELCFKCHADSTDRPASAISRQTPETNTRLEFAGTGASYHPVVSGGKNPDVPSLISPWTTASRMLCTDCHNNDEGTAMGGSGPNGPHGSAYPFLLERQLETTDGNVEGASTYALCYKCHDQGSILNDQSFPNHHQHVTDLKAACTTCHDPHGVPSRTHLINFNTTYVTAASNSKIEFTDTGRFKGSCSLRCHDHDHVDQTYGL